jgi:phosphomannomutase
MTDISHIFKAYDIRGKVGSELSEELMRNLGIVFGNWLPATGVVAIGRDMRPDSAALAQAVIEGLKASGRDVWDIGEVTSDMIYFAVGAHQLAGGVMITASHNPGEYNGVKLCREEARPVSLEAGLGDIRDIVLGDNLPTPAEQPGTVSSKDMAEGWINHVLDFVEPDKLKPLKIAVDAGNGMAGAIFPELEVHVPWETTEMYFELDGTFPNHEANPLKFETLADLIKTIKDNNLDGGIAFDGDGDRALLVDETGAVLTGGVMSALMSDYFLKKFPGAPIVYDARNSKTVPEVIEASGGKAIISRVGHSLIKQKMRELDAPFGGEASGHFYFRDNWYADSGLIGAVIGLYAAGLTGKKLSELREQYTHYNVIPETNFEVHDKDAVLAKLAETFKDGEQSTLDGLTVDMGDRWFNVRPSNTEPLLRLNVEASSQQDLDTLVDQITQIITQ